jgi:hypothetical protein
MPTQRVAGFDCVATFGDVERAQAAEAALLRAGVSTESIRISRAVGAAESAAAAEGSFFWRVVMVIVFWSITGTAVGAGIGAAFAQTGIGPGGTAGLVLQVASWALFGHLVAGILAGYLLLADRSQREFAPAATPHSGRAASVTLRVACDSRAQLDEARRIIGPHGPRAVSESVRYG